MFSVLWNKIKELVRKMLPKKSIESVLHITPVVSDRMIDAIQLWSNMYEGQSPWLKVPTPDNPTRIVSLGLPALIASEKARMVTLEMKSEITAPMKTNAAASAIQTNVDTENKVSVGNKVTTVSGTSAVTEPASERATFLNNQYKRLLKQIRRQLEYGIAKGGLVIKPYIVLHENTAKNSVSNNSATTDTTNDENALKSQNFASKSKMQYNKSISKAEIEFDFVQADRFFPLSFDANGKVVEAAFIQTKLDKSVNKVYIRLEYHKLENRTVTVQNLAFESTDTDLANSNNIKSASNLGNPIPLTQVAEWANLRPTTVIEDVDRLLFAYFKMPEANTVDPYSPLGVSGYSRVVQLIKDADMQYSRMLWEFEGGEMAIDVDRDALKFVTDDGSGGHSVLPMTQQRLFRKVDLNSEDTYNVFAPALRDASIINGLNTILMRIEDATGLSRGTLSEVTSQEAKTATELKILKQRSFATNADIQQALQDALEDTIYVMDVYCTLYDVATSGEYEVSFEWDDSIIIDSESELSKRITLMQNGLASHLEVRMWYFGETENQARLALDKVDEESMKAMQQNAEAAKLVGNGHSVDDSAQDDMKGSTKTLADKTSAKTTSGTQADNLNTPNKGKAQSVIKNS